MNNTDAAFMAFKVHLMGYLKQLQEEYLNETQSHMSTPEGRESMHEGELAEIADHLIATIEGGAWAAMDNMGRGSLMADASENPALAEYESSELWNPDRHDHAIRSRVGTYTNIFGEEVTSKSKRGGINIESRGKGKYAPKAPSFAMETAARWMMNGRLQTVLAEAVETFPWGRYFSVEVK